MRPLRRDRDRLRAISYTATEDGGEIMTMKEGAMSTSTTSALGERLSSVEREIAEIRAAPARAQAERLPPLTKLASKRTGRAVSDTRRMNVSSTGAQANPWSGGPSISADRCFVAFSSDASNLVKEDTNATGDDDSGDVFVHDRRTGKTTRVSVSLEILVLRHELAIARRQLGQTRTPRRGR
jgi:hypothetical protein